MIKILSLFFIVFLFNINNSKAWVGVWLGLEAGLGAINVLSEQLDNLDNTSKKKSSKKAVLCEGDNKHIVIFKNGFCPATYKYIGPAYDNENTNNISSNSISDNNSSYITSKSSNYTYCLTKKNIPYKTTNKKCNKKSDQEINEINYNSIYSKGYNNSSYITKKSSDPLYCKSIYDAQVKVFYYQDECPKGTTQSSLWSYENQDKNNNDSNFITKKSDKEKTSNKTIYCKNNNTERVNQFILPNCPKGYSVSNEASFYFQYENFKSKSELDIKYIAVNNLNLRSSPNGPVIGSLPLNTMVSTNRYDGVFEGGYDWKKILYGNGNTAWVASNFLSNEKIKKSNSNATFKSLNEFNLSMLFNKQFLKGLDFSNAKFTNLEKLPFCSTDNSDNYNNCFDTYYVDPSNIDNNEQNQCEFEYSGGFKNNNYYGFGSYKYFNCSDPKLDSEYVGFFKDGLMHGLGILSIADEKTIGLYDNNDLMYGYLKFSDTGASYIGEFKNNKYEGLGHYKFGNGEYYKGYFKNGKYHGKGIYFDVDGNKKNVGILKDGKFDSTEYVSDTEVSIENLNSKYAYLNFDDIIVYNNDPKTIYVENKSLSTQENQSSSNNLIVKKEKENTAKKEIDLTNLVRDENKREQNPPIIITEQEIFTKNEEVLLKGSINDESMIVGFVVGSGEITQPYDNNTFFEFKRYVPIGNSKILIVALDEWNNRAEFEVKVTRESPEVQTFFAQNKIEPLNPLKIKSTKDTNKLAIIIGVKDYRDIPNTEYSDNDANYFIDYASNTLGVPYGNIRSYVNSEAGKYDLLDLQSWIKNKITNKSLVYVFYSGHGMTINDKNYILPYDFRPSQIQASAYNKEEFLNEILNHDPIHVFAFFDACFTGHDRKGGQLLASAKNINIAAEENINKNLTIFNSSERSEYSTDFKFAKHGLFSYFLMKGLEGYADMNKDNSLTTFELHNYVRNNVSEAAMDLGYSQNPSLVASEDKILFEW